MGDETGAAQPQPVDVTHVSASLEQAYRESAISLARSLRRRGWGVPEVREQLAQTFPDRQVIEAALWESADRWRMAPRFGPARERRAPRQGRVVVIVVTTVLLLALCVWLVRGL